MWRMMEEQVEREVKRCNIIVRIIGDSLKIDKRKLISLLLIALDGIILIDV